MTNQAARMHHSSYHRLPSGGWKFGLVVLFLGIAFTLVVLRPWASEKDSVGLPVAPAAQATVAVPDALVPESATDAPAAPEVAPVQPDSTLNTNPSTRVPGASGYAPDFIPTEPSTADISPSLGSAMRVQEIDLSKVPAVAAVAEATGGIVDTRGAQYGDLTGDGQDEALVAVTADGTFGNLAYFVVSLVDGSPKTIWQATADPGSRNGLELRFSGAALVETVGVYGPEDPQCCPSLLQESVYAWDNGTFQLLDRQLIPRASEKQLSGD